MTLEEALKEYNDLTRDTFWGLEFYMYPDTDSPYLGQKSDKSDSLYNWKYHLRASYTLSSARAGALYRTDDLIEGINKLSNWLRTLPQKEYWPNTRVDLGTPLTPPNPNV